MDVETFRTLGNVAAKAADDELLPLAIREAARQMADLVAETFGEAGHRSAVAQPTKPGTLVRDGSLRPAADPPPPAIQLVEAVTITRPIAIEGNAEDGYAVRAKDGASESDVTAARIAQEIFDWASGKPMGPLSGALLHCATLALRMEQELGIKLA